MNKILKIAWWVVLFSLSGLWIYTEVFDNGLRMQIAEDSGHLYEKVFMAEENEEPPLNDVSIDGEPILLFAKNLMISAELNGISNYPKYGLMAFFALSLFYVGRRKTQPVGAGQPDNHPEKP